MKQQKELLTWDKWPLCLFSWRISIYTPCKLLARPLRDFRLRHWATDLSLRWSFKTEDATTGTSPNLIILSLYISATFLPFGQQAISKVLGALMERDCLLLRMNLHLVVSSPHEQNFKNALSWRDKLSVFDLIQFVCANFDFANPN